MSTYTIGILDNKGKKYSIVIILYEGIINHIDL